MLKTAKRKFKQTTTGESTLFQEVDNLSVRWQEWRKESNIMPRKATEDSPLKLNTKVFLRLMKKRDAIQKIITRQERKLAKVDAQLSEFSDWLKTLVKK